MKFIAIKTDDGTIKGKLAFYCRMLHVSRQGFYKYLSVKDRPWKYQTLADTMLEIHAEDVCNDTYGRVRMFQALTLKRPDGIPIPSERTGAGNGNHDEGNALPAYGRKRFYRIS